MNNETDFCSETKEKPMKNLIKTALRKPCFFFSTFLFDPLELMHKFRALPFFFRNLVRYRRQNRNESFNVEFGEIWYRSYDRFATAGIVQEHYFYQGLWAARFLFDNHVRKHVDVGSCLDGFIAHILPFCEVTYVDIRPIELQLKGFDFVRGSIKNIPFDDNSIENLTCLHVIEHIGLGRYGDPVDPDGYLAAARELTRVLSPGGTLLLSVPVGRERLCFDAHRIFAPQTIKDIFSGLELVEFSLIADKANGVLRNASFDDARSCNYGCGLFVFKKASTRISRAFGISK